MFFTKMLFGIKKMGQVFMLKDIWSLITFRQKAGLVATTILNVVDTAAKLIGPLALAKSVEAVAVSKEQTNFLFLELSPEILLYISTTANAVHLLMPYIKKMMLYGVQESIAEKLSEKIFDKAQELAIYTPLLNDLLSSTSKHLQHANFEANKLLSSVTENIHPSFLDAVLGTAFIFTSFEKKVGSVVLIYVFLALTINEFTARAAKITNRKQSAGLAFNDYIRHMYEVNINAETVYLFNRTNLEKLNSRYLYQKYITLVKKNACYELLAIIQPLLASLMQFLAVFYVASDNFKKFEIDEIVFLLAYVVNISGSVYLINKSFQDALTASKSFNKIYKFIGSFINQNLVMSDVSVVNDLNEMTPLLLNEAALTTKHYEINEVNSNIVLLEKIKFKQQFAIAFKNVSFGYDTSQLILNSVSFKIAVGQKVGLVGISGVGKSTLIKLLFGLLRPTNFDAVIEVFGKNIIDIPPQQLNELITLVRQQVEVFEENSSAYNILYGGAENDQLLAMKKNEDQHGVSSSSTELNNEWSAKLSSAAINTKLDGIIEGKTCRGLSGGQRQRIGMARAFIRNSKIFILDEPTSNLDSQTEEEVLGNFRKSVPHTTLMIAHRLSTLKDADRILFLGKKTPSAKGASIIEEGTHIELLHNNANYANLWRLQTR